MGIHSLCRSFFFLSLLFAVSLCSAEDSKFEVVGTTLCSDCTPKTSLPFSGLRVSVECKLKNGEIKKVGWANLDDQGKFQVSVPEEVVEDGQKLKQECYAQLQSAAAVPCATVDAAKMAIKSRSNGLTTFSPTQHLQFSSAFCSSKSFWPYFNYPPHPWFNHPPHPWFHHPKPPVPIIKPKPKPPVPVYKPKPKPKPPVYKPKPKPPVYKPKPPVYKPKPKLPVVKPIHPPVPIYKPKPKPPVYKPKPKPPVFKPIHPPVPIYKPKPKPPVVKPYVPIHKPKSKPLVRKPCPPLPKLPPIPPKYFHHPKFGHFPPLPKIPPKYLHHPIFGHFPPLPPSIPHSP